MARKKGKPKRVFGTVFQRRGKPGWYFRVNRRGYTTECYAGETEDVAEEFRDCVHGLFSQGVPVDEAVRSARKKITGVPLRRSEAPQTFGGVALVYLGSADHKEKKETTQARERNTLKGVTNPKSRHYGTWAKKPMEELELDDVNGWRFRRRDMGAAAQTIRNDLNMFSAVLQWAQDRKLVPPAFPNLFAQSRAKVKTGIQRKRTALSLMQTQEFVQRVREMQANEMLSIHERAVLVAPLYTGWRLSDVVNLRVRDVERSIPRDGNARTGERRSPQGLLRLMARIDTEKTSKEKYAFATGEFRECVEAIAAQGGRHLDAVMFHQDNGAPWSSRRILVKLRQVLGRCKSIPSRITDGDKYHVPFDYHSLRHTFATVGNEVGVDGLVLDALGGWAGGSQGTRSRYTHPSESSILDACERMARAVEDRTENRENCGPVSWTTIAQ